MQAYQDQNATKKPHQEKNRTLPWTFKGFNRGIERALKLTGLRSGAFQSEATSKAMAVQSLKKVIKNER